MKYKDKEKLLLTKIKEYKKDDWKFKGYYIFKNLNEFFYAASFHVSLKEDKISGYIGYKPMEIDNVFWDIIDEKPNKKMPLSFRGEAAFCIRETNFFSFNIEIKDISNPENEIIELLKIIDEKVLIKSRIINSPKKFQLEMMKNEEKNSVGIITSLIEECKFTAALNKIQEYKTKEFNSGFRFESEEFYDVAKNYIKNCC